MKRVCKKEAFLFLCIYSARDSIISKLPGEIMRIIYFKIIAPKFPTNWIKIFNVIKTLPFQCDQKFDGSGQVYSIYECTYKDFEVILGYKLSLELSQMQSILFWFNEIDDPDLFIKKSVIKNF